MTSYGSMPPVSAGEYGANAQSRGPAPSSVTTAVRLMFLGAALSVVGLIVAFAQKDDLRTQLQNQHPDWDSSKLDTAVNAGLAVSAVIGIVVLVLYVLLALQVGKGKNWARIVTWVIAGLGVLALGATLGGNATGLSKGLGVVSGLIDLAIIVLLLLAPSNAYFRRRQPV
jgi:hypothetical protein